MNLFYSLNCLNKTKFALLSLILIMSIGMKAQVAAYAFSQSSTTYSPITGGTVAGASTTTTTLDAQNYANLPIGFTFTFDGVNYTNFGVSADGWITMGTTISASTTPLSSGTSNNVISALGRDNYGRQFFTGTTAVSPTVTVTAGSNAGFSIGDLLSGTGLTTGTAVTAVGATTITMAANGISAGTARNIRAHNGVIRYETIGTAPNRKLVVQWSKFSRYSTTGPGDFMNFQIVLNETTNTVDINYNFPYVFTTAVTAQVGLRGASSADFNTRTSATSWTTTSAGSTNAATVTLSNTISPGLGLTYTWTPPSCAAPALTPVTNLTSTSADINWNAASPAPSGGYQYEIRVSGAGGSGATGLVTSGNTAGLTAAISGLSANTTYNIYVRSDCGSSVFSSWSTVGTFLTPCNSISTFPYQEGFESLSVANTDVSCMTSSPLVSLATKTRTYITSATGTNSALIARTGSKFSAVYWSPAATGGYFFSAPLTLTGGVSYDASVYYRTDGVAWTDATLYYGTSANTAAMTNTIATVANAAATTYTKISGSFIPATTGTYYIAYRAYNSTTSPNYCSFDDLEVKLTPTCFEPVVTAPTSVGSSTATINWTAPATGTAPLDYQYEVRSSGAVGSGALGLITSGSVAAATTSVAITGLAGGNTYQSYVRSICSVGDTSSWSSGSFNTNAVTSVQTGSWNNPATWSSSSVPVCGEGVLISSGHIVTVNSTGNEAKNLTISNGGNLTVSSGTLTVGCTNNNAFLRDSGIISVTGGTLNINGNLYVHTGDTLEQTGGDIVVDGNSNNPMTSVLTGTNIVEIRSNMLNLTGGKLTIVDPHAGASTSDYVFNYNNTTHYNTGIAHTIQLGNGTSTDTGGHSSGYHLNTYPSSGSISFGNFIMNSNTIKKGYTAFVYSLGVQGDFTVTKGDFRNSGTTYVAGNIINNDTMTISGTLGFANYKSVTVSDVITPQSITGTGIFRNATTSPAYNFNNITIQNTSSTGVTFTPLNNLSGLAGFQGINTNGITFSGNGKATTAAGHTVLWGRFNSRGTGTFSASTTGGMTSGSTFAIGNTKTQVGSTLSMATNHSSTICRFPFINSTNSERSVFLTKNALDSGILAFKYSEVPGTSAISLTDGSYTLDQRSNDSFEFIQLGLPLSTSSFDIAITANNVFGGALTADSARIIQANGLVGNHLKGTNIPTANRMILNYSQLTGGAFYVAVNSNEIPFASTQSGDWNVPATWNKTRVPLCSDVVNIAAGHTVDITTSGNVSKNIFVAAGSVLNMSSGTLTVGCSDNNSILRLTGGTFNMSGGTLTLNGKFMTNHGSSIFNHSGGDIIVDFNSGVSTTSIMPGSHGLAGGHGVDMIAFTSTNINLTGGTFTIKDPVLSSATGDVAFKIYPNSSTLNCGSGSNWILNIGDGSTGGNRGGHTSGFNINTANTAGYKINGTININMAVDSPNRFVTTAANTAVKDLNIYKGDLRISANTYIYGNLTNNDTLTSTGALIIGDYVVATPTASTLSQSIGGTGVYRNNSTPASVTANLGSITFNNENATGVTLNTPLSVSSTITLTKGIINTTMTNILKIGTSTGNGTVNYVYANTNYVNGPFQRNFYNNTAPGQTSVTTAQVMPVGENGIALPMYLNTKTTSNGLVTMTAQAFSSNTGTPGTGVTNMTGRTWFLEPTLTTSANFQGTFLGLGDTMTANATSLKMLQSSTAFGTFDGTPGGSSFLAGTVNQIRQNILIEPLSFVNYYSYGDLAPCSAPAGFPTNPVISLKTNTSAQLTFDPITPTPPTGYLILVDTAGQTPTMPTDNFSYNTIGANTALQCRVQGTITTSPFTLSMTGLAAGISYDVYAIPFNNSGCAGPVYNTGGITPLTNFTTCAAAIATPTLFTYSNQTSTGFNIGWTGTATAGTYNYYISVATTSTFASGTFVPGYIDSNIGTGTTFIMAGLSPGTTYFVRVRAQDQTSACVSPYLYGNSIATECTSSVTSISENFDGVLNGSIATVWPSCWKKVTNIGSSYLITTNFSPPASLYFVGSTTVPSTISLPPVSNSASGTQRIRFKLYASGLTSKMLFGYLTNPADPTTFVALDSFLPTVSAQWQDFLYGPITTPFGINTLAFKHNGGSTSAYYIDNFNYETMPSCSVAEAGTSSITSTSLCNGENVKVTATGFNKDSLNLTYVWQTSTNGTTWINKGTPSNKYSLLTDTPSNSTYYRFVVECATSGSILDSTNHHFVSVTSPSVISTTTDTVCGLDTVILTATGSDTAFYWFSQPVGGPILARNDTLSVVISTDSTFYVVNGVGTYPSTFTGDGDWQHLATVGQFQTTAITGACVVLTVTAPTVINSFDIYPSAIVGTNFTIEARSGTAAASSSAVTHTYTGTTNVTNSGAPSAAQTVPVNWTFAPGIYFIGFPTTANNPSCWRSQVPTSGYPWPLTVGGAEITGSSASGTTTISDIYQYFFFNMKSGAGCFSPRMPVVAKSLTPPVLALDSPDFTICKGTTTALVGATAATIGNYSTYNWSPVSGVSSPSAANSMFSPTTTTTYTLNATDGTCNNSKSFTITTADTPSRLTVSQGVTKAHCDAGFDSLVVSGGLVPASTKIGTATSTNTTTTPFKRYWGGHKTQSLYTAADLNSVGLIAGSEITSIGWLSLTGTPTQMTNFSIDVGMVSNTTLGSAFLAGASYNVFSSASHTPSTGVGNNNYTLNTPLVWDGTSSLLVQTCFNNNDAGLATLNSLSIESTTSATGLCLYLSEDNSATTCSNSVTPTSSTLRPNLNIGFKIPNVTWSPITSLFSNKALTTPYTIGHASKLFSKPTVTTKYYVQSQVGNCIVRDSIIDSVNNTTSMITLVGSSTSNAVSQCVDGPWTYYGSSSNPDQFILAINKGASVMNGETITVEVLGSHPTSSNSAGVNQEHGSFFMKRGWNVEGTTSGPVTVRFFYDPTDSADACATRDADSAAIKTNNPNSLMVKTPFKWFKSLGTPYNATWRASVIGNKFPSSHVNLTPSAYGVLNGINYVEFSGITSFSGGTGGAGFGAPGAGGVGLPVTWAGFDVTALESGNRLTWSTASELNSDYFQVEYSYDAINFTTLAEKIKAAGSSNLTNKYTSSHADFSSYVYYRIKQVDIDGRIDYSVVKSVKRSKLATFKVDIYPIPMDKSNIINLNVSSVDKSTLVLKMTDVTGKVMKSKSYTPNTETIMESFDMSNMATGIYFIEVKNAQGKQVVKIVK